MADLGDGLLVLVRVERHVRGHQESWLDLARHVAGAISGRVMGVQGEAAEERRHSGNTGADGHQVRLGLGDVDVAALRVLDVVAVRSAVAGPDDAEAVPVEPIPRRAVLGM